VSPCACADPPSATATNAALDVVSAARDPAANGFAAESRPGLAFERARIQRALKNRLRYRYVQPTVVPERGGWKVVSPCCSRRIDPEGGVIDIAWLVPLDATRWRLHAREHALGAWREVLDSERLSDLLARLCEDPLHEFWV